MPLAAPVTMARLPASRAIARPGSATRVEDGAGEEPGALVAALGRLVAEGEADVLARRRRSAKNAGPAVYCSPRPPSPARRAWRGRCRSGSLIQMKKPPSGRLISASVPVEHLAEAAHHRVALVAVDGDQRADVLLQVVAQEVGGHARHVRVHAAAEEEAWSAGIISRGAQSQPSRTPAPRIFESVPARMVRPRRVERVERRHGPRPRSAARRRRRLPGSACRTPRPAPPAPGGAAATSSGPTGSGS